MSLRRAFLIAAAVFVSVALAASVALILFTTLLHRNANVLETSIESIRIAEEIEVELLSYRATNDPLFRVSTEHRLKQLIADSRGYAGTPDENELVTNLEQQTAEYMASIQRIAPSAVSLASIQESTRTEFEGALRLTKDLINLNVEQGRAIQVSTERADYMANFVGIGVLMFVVTGLGVIGWWLRVAAFRPAIQLARTIERYAKGERDTRAPEQGADEFRQIAHHFNEMAFTIEKQRKGQLAFLAGVAHDLRNPLSALKMASAVILPDKPLPPEDRLRQSYARVQRQTDKLERMIFDFLDAARIEAGTLELQMEETDARMIVDATVDLFAPTTPNHQLVVQAPDEPVRLTCDPTRIEQVLNNLVSNAIKYSPQGGEVRVSVENRVNSVAISVSDNGLGISTKDKEILFEPFRRTGASTESIPGVGLGLFVARRIVEAHGGRITVESEVGRGATFSIVLPVKPQAETAVPRLSTTNRSASPQR